MTRLRVMISATIVACAGMLALLYRFSPAQHSFYPRCPIYATTHLLCPGCGGTRAMHALLHLDFYEALHYNALLTVLAPMLLVWFAYFSWQGLRNDRLPGVALPRLVTISLCVVVVMFTVARNTGIAFVI